MPVNDHLQCAVGAFSNFLDLGDPPGATGDHGLQPYASSLQLCNPLIEIYPYTPFPPSLPQGFSDYSSEP
eukprot:3784905-Prymnesium_polylepis.1